MYVLGLEFRFIIYLTIGNDLRQYFHCIAIRLSLIDFDLNTRHNLDLR